MLYPARFRDLLDWDTINKLTMNPDFKKFLDRVKTDLGSDEVRDRVRTEEELAASIYRKK
jgi:hypothetical protein